MISYSSLGPDLRMCDVVFAGSHDAGITEGSGPTKAQSDSIYAQATSGARFFDVRIGAFTEGNKVKLKTFHAADKLQFNKVQTVTLTREGQAPQQKIVQTMSLVPLAGAAGEGLKSILAGALKFLLENGHEFLVLIFSKSTNMDIVVNMVDRVLGSKQFGTPGPLNTKTLRQLAGHVVCVYTEANDTIRDIASYQQIAHGAERATSRFLHDNLFKTRAAYNDECNGIQYYGKGGLTEDISGDSEKASANAMLQRAKMLDGAAVQGCEKLLGMVYITTTGGLSSIKGRDKKLWKDKRINPLLRIWESNELVENIQDRMPRNINATDQSAAPDLKKFFPNIVMMDFVSMGRCQTIFNINQQSTGPLGVKTRRTLIRSAGA